jgi:hypothetical protein
MAPDYATTKRVSTAGLSPSTDEPFQLRIGKEPGPQLPARLPPGRDRLRDPEASMVSAGVVAGDERETAAIATSTGSPDSEPVVATVGHEPVLARRTIVRVRVATRTNSARSCAVQPRWSERH